MHETISIWHRGCMIWRQTLHITEGSHQLYCCFTNLDIDVGQNLIKTIALWKPYKTPPCYRSGALESPMYHRILILGSSYELQKHIRPPSPAAIALRAPGKLSLQSKGHRTPPWIEKELGAHITKYFCKGTFNGQATYNHNKYVLEYVIDNESNLSLREAEIVHQISPAFLLKDQRITYSLCIVI